MMRDTRLEEVSGDGYDIPVFVAHRSFEDHLESNRKFVGENLDEFVSKLAQRSGKDISSANPIQGTDLPDGSRVHLSRQDVAPRGPNFTIRFFSEEPFTPVDIIQTGTASAEMLAYLWLLIEHDHHGLIVGDTSSGKTTLLNALSMFIPPDKKIVSAEDTRELQLPHDNWVSLVTREAYSGGHIEIDAQDLLVAALRMDPDFIPVGEIRGEEARMMFQALSTGHTSYATMHADSIETVLTRLRNEPMKINDPQIGELGFVTVQMRAGDDEMNTASRRRTKRVYEITGVSENVDGATKIEYQETYRWNAHDDSYEMVSDSHHLTQLLQQTDIDVQSEWARRQRVLQYLAQNDINRYEPVTTVIQAYMRVPEMVLNDIKDHELSIEELKEL